MRKLLVSLTLSLLSLVALFVVSVSSVSASEARNHGPRIKAKDSTSFNWSGYADINQTYSDVKGSWVVPTVNCAGVTQNTYSSAWLGLDGYNTNTVEQTGTEQDCINGAASYYAWFEMYPKPSYRVSLPVNAGNTINAEVKYLGGGYFQLSLVNASTGQNFNITQRLNKAQRQSAEWIMEAPFSGGILPLSNFGTINFSSSLANGSPISAFLFDPITMVNSSGATKASPSALSPDGTAFSVTWFASN